MLRLGLLLRAVVVLSGILSGLCSAVILVGRASPRPDDLSLLAAGCPVEPCILGLSPGYSLWGEAERVAEGLPDARYYTNYFILPLARRSEIAVFRSIDKLFVGRINISLPENTAISVGWIIAQFGQPCGITLYARSQMVTLRYPFMLVNTMMEDWRVVANAPVMSFFIHDPHFQLKVYTNPCLDRMSSRDAVNRTWRGFTNVYVYLFRDFQSPE